MLIDGWKYYNHAAIPTCAPHEMPLMEPVYNGNIWKMSGHPFIVRWTSDYDCKYDTSWWYCIKDTPFDIDKLKAKRRYEINKGKKNFVVKEICTKNYINKLFDIEKQAFLGWPEKYRPKLDRKIFMENIKQENFYKVYGAFERTTENLCGYATLKKTNEKVIEFVSLRVDPKYEKDGINAALVNEILCDNNDFIDDYGYIYDGSRSINHETAFQDYLEKYFDFRKAYCKLHIKFKFPLSIIIKLCFCLKKVIYKMDNKKGFHQIASLLHMYEIMEESNE